MEYLNKQILEITCSVNNTYDPAIPVAQVLDKQS